VDVVDGRLGGARGVGGEAAAVGGRHWPGLGSCKLAAAASVRAWRWRKWV
jgi:hypothetical protein